MVLKALSWMYWASFSSLTLPVAVIGEMLGKATGIELTHAVQPVLQASWEPDLWGRLRYGRNAVQATYASAQADYEFGRQSLAAAIAKSWFTAGETWLQLQLAEQMIASSQELVTLAEKRWQVGSGNEQDVVLARATLGSFQDAAKQVRFAHEQTLRALFGGAAPRSATEAIAADCTRRVGCGLAPAMRIDWSV